MKAKELIAKLQELDPEAEIWLPATNKQGIPTYALLDYVLDCKYASIYGDIFNNPGDVDLRLLKDGHDEDMVIVLCIRGEWLMFFGLGEVARAHNKASRVGYVIYHRTRGGTPPRIRCYDCIAPPALQLALL